MTITREQLKALDFREVEPDYEITREGRYFVADTGVLFNYKLYVLAGGRIYRAQTSVLNRKGYSLDSFMQRVHKDVKKPLNIQEKM